MEGEGGRADGGASQHRPESFSFEPVECEQFAVQCTRCQKWRLVPGVAAYEAIRARALSVPFTCAQGQIWRADGSCDEPAELERDGTRHWAFEMDSNIPETPTGWKRRVIVRGPCARQYADVYYDTPPPQNQVLRSRIDVERFLMKYPEYKAQGISAQCFSFTPPEASPEPNLHRQKNSRTTQPSPRLSGPSKPSPAPASPMPTPDHSSACTGADQHSTSLKRSAEHALAPVRGRKRATTVQTTSKGASASHGHGSKPAKQDNVEVIDITGSDNESVSDDEECGYCPSTGE